MSISSLIGSESSKHTEQSPRAATTHNSPNAEPTRTRSPHRPRSTSVRSDLGQSHRRLSPRQLLDREYAQAGRQNYDANRTFATLPPGPPANTSIFRPYQSSPTSTTGDARPPNAAHDIPRPNSQPVLVQEERGESWRNVPPAVQRELSGFRQFNQTFRATEASRSGSNSESLERRFADDVSRREHSPVYGRSGAFQASHASNQSGGPARKEFAGLFRPAFPQDDGQSRGQPPTHQPQQHARMPEPGFATSTHSATDDVGGDGRFRHYGVGVTHEQGERQRIDHYRRELVEDGGATQRAFLNVSPDWTRKNGRGSPLPQAVQGAQPRPGNSGRDLSVKSEFGRMFSGLGSGVGGSNTPIAGFSANGVSTPSRTSPGRIGDGGQAIQSTETDTGADGEPLPRNKEGRPAEDNESMDGRNTPTAARGSKRAKTGPATHHHHHHAHGHAHHHHHHHHDDHGHHTAAGFSTLRFPANANGTQPGATTTHHHHHHHGGHAHHHHHSAMAKPSAPAIAPEIKIVDHNLVQSVAGLPRSHLGSVLYSTKLSSPSDKSNFIKHAFKSIPLPIPHLEGLSLIHISEPTRPY